MTNSPAVADRDPAWSPDGKSIAYFSDESGEYALHIAPQNGLGPVKKINLANKSGYYYSPTWSPDSKKIAYEDLGFGLWYVDIEKGTPVRVDTDRLDQGPSFNQTWSPDSRWLAYIKPLKNNLHAVYIYSIEAAKTEQISDGMSDTASPAFDKNGKYLYFTASTDVALASEAGMTSIGRPVTRSVYAAVLKKDVASPVAPESDEEKSKEEKAKEEKENGGKSKDATSSDADKDKSKDSDKDKDKDKNKEAVKPPPKVDIDFERIGQRIVALPIPARNYYGLAAGKEGELYIAEGSPAPSFNGPPSFTLQKFTSEDAQDREISGRDFDISLFPRMAKKFCTRPASSGSSRGRRRAEIGRWRAEARRDGSLCRSAGGVAADLSRDLANRARFLL